MTASVIRRVDPGPRASAAVIHGGVAHLVSQVAADPPGDFADEARVVLAQVDALLERSGSARDRLLTATVYLADMDLFEAMNAVWDAWVPAGAAPTRVTIETSLTRPHWRIAVQVTAAVRGGRRRRTG